MQTVTKKHKEVVVRDMSLQDALAGRRIDEVRLSGQDFAHLLHMRDDQKLAWIKRVAMRFGL